MSLQGPYEFWEMVDGETRKIHVTRFDEGTAVIQPRGPFNTAQKEIKVLRVYLAPGDKVTVPSYWDVTSQHLIVALKTRLMQGDFRGLRFEIQKFGVAPSARFTVSIERET